MRRWAAVVFAIAALVVLILEDRSAERGAQRERERKQREGTT